MNPEVNAVQPYPDNPFQKPVSRRHFLYLLGGSTAAVIGIGKLYDLLTWPERIVTSCEVWWGSSTILQIANYLYSITQTEQEKDKYAYTYQDDWMKDGAINRNTSLIDKNGHATYLRAKVGAIIGDLTHFLDLVDLKVIKFPVPPSTFNIFIGGNEMTSRMSVRDTLGGVKGVVDRIHKHYPEAQLRIGEVFQIKVNDDKVWRETYNSGLETNFSLGEYAKFVTVIPTQPIVEKSGPGGIPVLDESIFIDDRHLNEPGLADFISLMRKYRKPLPSNRTFIIPLSTSLDHQETYSPTQSQSASAIYI